MSIDGIKSTTTAATTQAAAAAAATATAQAASATPETNTVKATATAAGTGKPRLVDLVDYGDDKQEVYAQMLGRWMIKSPGMMLFAGRSGFMRSVTSALTGVPKETLKEFAYRADLMRVPGMTPDMVKVIRNPLIVGISDIKGPGDLGKSALADIVSFVRLIGLGNSLGDVSSVIQAARTMENKVRE